MTGSQVKLYFAPFQGITTQPFRSVFARHFTGIDKFFTPYFSNFSPGHPLTRSKLAALKNQAENGIEVVPQVLSKDAEEIIWLARCCEELGFKELNWNLGCPYPQVANKKRGSGLLPYPALVDEILEKVMREIRLAFSVKCRLGYSSATEILQLAPVLNRYPLHEITLHARIGRQLYSGQPDLGSFAGAAATIRASLVYNGDIFGLNDYERFRTRFTEIEKLMIGRGILADPFLPAMIKGHKIPQNPEEVLRKFMNDLYFAIRKERNDSPTALNSMKEYWRYLAGSFDDPGKVFRKIRKSRSFTEYEDGVTLIFETHKRKATSPTGNGTLKT